MESSIKILRKITYKNKVIGYIINTFNTEISVICNRKVYDTGRGIKYKFEGRLNICGVGIVNKKEMLDIVSKALKSGLNFRFENFKVKPVYGKVSIQDNGDIPTIESGERLSDLRYMRQRVMETGLEAEHYHIAYYHINTFGDYLPLEYYKS